MGGRNLLKEVRLEWSAAAVCVRVAVASPGPFRSYSRIVTVASGDSSFVYMCTSLTTARSTAATATQRHLWRERQAEGELSDSTRYRPP